MGLIVLIFSAYGFLFSQDLAPGFPNRSADFDVLPGFKNPPAGYGEVPFYWWIGDTLTRERLMWQLDLLEGKSISSLQINYAHDDKGGLKWGLSFPSKPALFTEAWWDLVGWFMQEAKKRGMAISLSDYTLGVGQNSYVDDAIRAYPEINGYELYHETKTVSSNVVLEWQIPANTLSVMAYRSQGGKIDAGSAVDLIRFIRHSALKWTAGKGEWLAVIVYAKRKVPSLDPMNPLSGKAYIENFFQRFEDRFPGEAGKGFNFFFSDELDFQLSGYLWNDIFEKEFQKRKGYSIIPELPALFVDTGRKTAKVRLDYNDVMVSLSEDGFFRPVYEWQQQRGMIYGCDHGGRGKDVTEFGDYFRTQKYNQGPGCDQPVLMQDVIKNKVASSIAHLYERPRTWLEGFHSSGWSTNSAELTHAILENYAMGQNLLSLHGLYYSTHGGWWEWAPPCNHFRMPYYAHIQPLMKAVERLSYVLSQGYHRCDVALLYPVEPMITKMDGENSVKAAFGAGEHLYNNGIDFDFMDYESVQRAEVVKNELHISHEKYRVLIFPSMQAIRYSTIKKALEFFREGGIVINFGDLPQATDRVGSDDTKLTGILTELFGRSASDSLFYGEVNVSKNNGKAVCLKKVQDVHAFIANSLPVDFKVMSASADGALPRVMHRVIGRRDLYAVYNLEKGTECFFRSKGRIELWDPFSGNMRRLFHSKQTENGTLVRLPLEKTEIQLLVFNPDENFTRIDTTNLDEILAVEEYGNQSELTGFAESRGKKFAVLQTSSEKIYLQGEADEPLPPVTLGEEWEFEIKPVLDNRWGDYHWPPTNELIGPEIRRTKYMDESEMTKNCEEPDYDDSSWPVVSNGFGPVFRKLGPLPDDISMKEVAKQIFSASGISMVDSIAVNGRNYGWQPYAISWRYGVENDPGHQGYHGLKEKMYDSFIRLGRKAQSWTSTLYEKESEGSRYFLSADVIAPHAGTYQVLYGDIKPAAFWINQTECDTADVSVDLRKGSNKLLLNYDKPGTTFAVFKKKGDFQNQAVTGEGSLAMKWYGDSSILAFDTRAAEKNPAGWYRFESAPGLTRLDFSAYGEVRLWINGAEYPVVQDSTRPDFSMSYHVGLGDTLSKPAQIAIRIGHKRGFYAGAALPSPIRMTCGKGVFTSGDWSKADGLYAYSGGASYSKNIILTEEQIKSGIVLDLGRVNSSAEVTVNGKTAGTKLAPPYRFDISGLVRSGENRLAILVYNTAANHYTSIPTRYRKSLESGLIGPVTLNFMNKVKLKTIK